MTALAGRVLTTKVAPVAVGSAVVALLAVDVVLPVPSSVVSVAEDGMILQVDGTDRGFARATLHSVAVQYRKTAKGAVIGLVVGLALAYPNAKLQGAGVAARSIVADTVFGAAIGALNTSYRTVYRVTLAGPPTQ